MAKKSPKKQLRDAVKKANRDDKVFSKTMGKVIDEAGNIGKHKTSK